MKAKHSNTVQSKQTFMKVLIGIALLMCIFIPVTASYAFDDKGEVPEKQETPIDDPSKDDADTKEVDKKDETKKIETDSVEKEAVKEESNNNVNNGPQTLTVTGNAWGWSTTSGMDFTYNAEKDLYSVNIPAVLPEALTEWKIVKDHSWTVNWGGTISYSDKKGQCRGVNGGPNIAPPTTDESFTIYFKYYYDSVAYIGVNMEPVPDNGDVYVNLNRGNIDTATSSLLLSKGWQLESNLWVKHHCSSQTQQQVMSDWDGIEPALYYYKYVGFDSPPSSEVVTGVVCFTCKYDFDYGKELIIVGAFNGWSDNDAIHMTYDASNHSYTANITDQLKGGWKIKAVGSWDFNRGGYSLYYDATKQINFAAFDGSDYVFPDTSNYSIVISTVDNDLDRVYVNTGTNPKNIIMHSNDNTSKFQYMLDGPATETSNVLQYLPEEDCAEFSVDNVQKEGVDTVALVCKDSAGNIKHTVYFKVKHDEDYIYINPQCLFLSKDVSSVKVDVSVWTQNSIPKKISLSSTTDGKEFLYYSEASESWLEMVNLEFGVGNNVKSFNFVKGPFPETILISDDQKNGGIIIKSADPERAVDPKNFFYDEVNQNIYVDYNDQKNYAVKSCDKNKGTIIPEEVIDVKSFTDCAYKIEDNKITFTLGSLVKTFEAKALDGYKFDGWVDANGNKITKYDGNIGEIADFNASFVVDKIEPIHPSGDDSGQADNVSGSANTGDSTPFIALIACVCGCALLLKKRHVKQ